MNRYFTTITNTRGDSLPGFKARVLSSTGEIVNLASDNSGTAIADDLAIADDEGVVNFFWQAADGQTLQFLDAADNLVRSIPNFANNQNLANMYGTIVIGSLPTMGAFTGTTIADDSTVKQSLQSLETAVETKANASAVGITSSAANLGAFTSPLIDDNATVKAALESIGTNLAASTGGTSVKFVQPYTDALARTITGKFRDYVSITDSAGVVGDYAGTPGAGTDCTAGIQDAVDYCITEGQNLLIPNGRFRTTAAINIARGTTQDPTEGGMRGITIRGGGPASCQIISDHSGDALTYQGGAGAGWHTYFLMDGIGFTRSTLNQSAGSIGLNMLETAYLRVQGCDFYGFEFGLYGVDVLSSDFIANTIRGNGKGFRFLRGTRSYPNAINMIGNKILNNIVYGGYVTGGSNFNIIGGSIESNGYTGSLEDVNSWGVRVDDAGYEGAVGLNMQGVYTENNNGVADVYIVQSANAVMHNIDGCGFLRFADARRVTANILQFVGTTGTRTIVKGCGFKSLTGYTDSAARPFIGGTDFTVIDGGNVYRDVSGGTTGLLPGVFDPQGKWQGIVAGDGTATSLPAGWSSSRASAGVYTVTHGLGLAANTHSLTVTATGGSGSTNGRVCTGFVQSSNSFEVYTGDLTGAATDSAFDFRLTKI